MGYRGLPSLSNSCRLAYLCMGSECRPLQLHTLKWHRRGDLRIMAKDFVEYSSTIDFRLCDRMPDGQLHLPQCRPQLSLQYYWLEHRDTRFLWSTDDPDYHRRSETQHGHSCSADAGLWNEYGDPTAFG